MQPTASREILVILERDTTRSRRLMRKSFGGRGENKLQGEIPMAQHNRLSTREAEVVKLLMQGKSNKLIASALRISTSTVEFHLKNIYVKYEVSSRVELILKLGNTPGTVEPEKLGLSVVDGQRENADDRERLNYRNWATSFRAAVSKIGKELRMQNVANSDARSGSTTLTFYDAIRVCLTKYAEFEGRASRAEFWWFALFVTLVATALAYFSENLSSVFMIAMLLPFLAAGTRRLRDSGKSGWWQLYLLVPVGGLVILGVLWAQPPTSALPDSTLPA